MRKIFKNEENRIFATVMIITIIAACLPLITRYCFLGHDTSYHLLRIEALKEGILAGKPFLKVNMLFFGGAGYASSMFYPDFLLYIPALLRAAGLGINLSFHIFIALCIILTCLSVYFCTKGITGNKYAALAAAVILTLSNYFLDDIYVRAAVGEVTAFIFIPFVIYGIYNTLYENMDKPQLLSIGFMGLLLCHTLSFLICILLTTGLFVLHIKTFIKNPKIILRVFVTGIVSAGITSLYWLPMLEQFLKAKFYVSTAQWMDPSLEALQISEGLGNTFPTLGISVAVFCLSLIFIRKKEKDNLYRFCILLIIASVAMFICSTDIFPWKRLGKILATVQFPWRLYTVTSVCFAMASGIAIYKGINSVTLSKLVIFKEKSEAEDNCVMAKGSLFLVITVMLVSSLGAMSLRNIEYYDYSLDYYSYKPFTASVIGGEWLPSTVVDMDTIVEKSEHAVSAEGKEVEFSRVKNEVNLGLNEETEWVDVPLIYYDGYSAKAEDGRELKVDGNGDNGFLRLYPEGTRGNIRVFYKGTSIQHMAFGVSAAFIVIILCCFVYIKSKNKRGDKG